MTYVYAMSHSISFRELADKAPSPDEAEKAKVKAAKAAKVKAEKAVRVKAAKEASKEASRIARDAKQKGRDRTHREQKGRDRTKRVRTAGQLEDAKKKRNEAKQTSTNSTQ